MSAEDRWEVPQGRRNGLAETNILVKNAGQDAVVYYPGSGSDILNPLFATYARGRYYIFVDPGVIEYKITQNLDGGIREPSKAALGAQDSAKILKDLNIGSKAVNAWTFEFEGSSRFVFLFDESHDAFLAQNHFEFDVLFEKDFWETSDTVDLKVVSTHLKTNGIYTTNSSKVGGLSAFYACLFGLEFRGQAQINGAQYTFQKTGNGKAVTPEQLVIIHDQCMQIAQASLVDEEYFMPLDFKDRDLCLKQFGAVTDQIHEVLTPQNVTKEAAKPIAKQFVVVAAGPQLGNYNTLINEAFA